MIKYTFFWGGPFSQWYPSTFIDDNGVMYNCCEQYMMAKKAEVFNDTETYDLIMKETDPKLQKKLGREVKNFDTHTWESCCESIVYDANVYKFTQNPKLRLCLEKTKGTELVEASPYDKIWGIGLGQEHPDRFDKTKWRGKNLLGLILDDVRDNLND